MYLVTEARLEAGKRPDHALSMLDVAIQRDPTLVDAKLQRALLLWRVHRSSEAIAAAEAILREHPRAGAAHALLSRFYESEDRSRSSQHRQRAASMNVDDNYYRALLEQDDHQAIALLSEIIDEDGQTEDLLLERIVRYQNVRDFDAMLRDAADLQELEPQSASAWNAIGTAHKAMENYEEALRSYDHSLKYGPDMPQTYLHRGHIMGLLGRHAEAVADCTQAIRLDPRAGLAYSLRAWARFSLGETNAALADCEEAIRLSPWDARAYCCRGMIARTRGEFSAAMSDFNVAIEKDPEFIDAYTQRALLHYLHRNYDAVVSDMTFVIQRLPVGDRHRAQTAVACDLRARAQENLGRWDLALADFNRAVDLDPTSASALYNRGRCHRLMGDYDAALADHDAAVQLTGGAASMLVGRALAHRYQGNVESAVQDLRLAVERAETRQKSLLLVRLWEALALSGDAAAAAATLKDAGSAADTPPWTLNIVAVLKGEAPAAKLALEAQSDDARCDAFYYSGIKALVDGRRADAAAAFRLCLGTGFVDLDEYDLARWHRARLDAEAAPERTSDE
jgi:tetratricopeptide (TPR) repeat protein